MSNLLNRIDRRTSRHETWLQFKAGCRSLRRNRIKVAAVVAYALFVVLFWLAWFFIPPQGGIMPIMSVFILSFVLPLAGMSGAFCMLVKFGKPSDAVTTSDKLYQIGLVNHADQAPTPIEKYRHKDNRRVTVRELLTHGIDLPTFYNNKLAIEKSLDCHVIKTVEKENSKEMVVMYTAPATSAFPENLHWHDELLDPEKFVLVCGENLMERETVNLSRVPHILLGGASGSGKTVLLKSLIMQCVKKGAEVYIADFKGGVDFPYQWREKCEFITDETRLLETLTKLVEELERRKVILTHKSLANIDEYNAQGGELKRKIFACDEIAEVLDKTGLTKNDSRKPIIEKIEGCLSTIARLGRAYGVHLIISTQRPDANILTGQIKSNIQYRVCGRADKILSGIILDNTDAADQIPHDAQGRFITSTGVVFQGYMLDEKKVIL